MPAIDALVQGLRDEGRVVRRATFTLDREKARDKLRQFQLADPRGYVLELVQAGVLKGATHIDLTLDADDLILRFDGRPFTHEDAEELYAAMFVRGAAVDLRARRQLALGLNAALGLNPSFVRLRSGNLALLMRPATDDQLTALPEAVSETVIHVHERFRPGVLARFFSRLGGDLAEADLVRQRCVHAAIPLCINGEAIARCQVPAEVIGVVPLVGPAMRGCAGFVEAEGGKGCVRLVKDGVWIAAKAIPGAHPRLFAVVEGDDLVKDVSQTNIVDDVALERVMALVRAAEPAAARALLEVGIPSEAVAQSAIGTLLREVLLHSKNPEAVAADSHLAELTKLPLWRDARGRAPPLSLAEVIRQAREFGKVLWAGRGFPEVTTGRAVVLLPSPGERAAFRGFFGDACADHTSTLARLAKRMEHEARWRARKMDAVLPADRWDTRYHARLPIEGTGVRGELAIVSLSEPDSRLFLFKEGCLLVERTARLPIGGLEVALQAELTPNAFYNDARRDEALARALLEVARLVPPLMESWAERLLGGSGQSSLLAVARRYLLGYLAWATGPQPGAAFLEAYGFAKRNALRFARELDDADVWRSGWLALGEGEPGAGARLNWLRTTNGRWWSITELEQVRARDRTLRYVLDDQPLGVPLEVGPVLHLSREEHAVLGRLLPVGALTDFSDEYQAAGAEAAFLKRPAAMPVVVFPGLAKVDIATDDGITGELALVDEAACDSRRPMACVALRQRQRLLAEVEIDLPYGFAVAEVNDDQLAANGEWNEVRRNDRFRRVSAVVREAVDRALAELAEAYPRLTRVQQVAAGDALLEVLATFRPQRRNGEIILPVPALGQVPLFQRLGKDAVSLAAVLAEVEAHGTILFAKPDVEDRPDPGEWVLVLGELEFRVLHRWVGGRAIVDAAPLFAERRRQRALERLPVLDTLELPAGEVLVSAAVGEGEVKGFVGLPRRYAEVVTMMQLTLAKAGRYLATVERPAPMHLIARLEDPALPTDEDGELSSSFGLERAAATCVGAIPTVIESLCSAWHELAPPDRAVAWRHLLDFFVMRDQRRRGSVRKLEEVYQQAAVITGFAGVGDRLHSLEEILQVAQRTGSVPYLRHALAGEPLEPNRVMLLLRRPEWLCLEALNVKLEDYEKHWLEEQEGRRRRARSAQLAFAVPADALVSLRAEHKGIVAELWLPAVHQAKHELIFGRGGKEVERRTTSGPLACAGAVYGDNLPVSRDWRRVELDREQVEWIDQLGARLFTELARRWQQGKLEVGARRVASLYLARLALELRRRVKDGQARVPVELSRLYRRLRNLPLLSLPSGKAISLLQAQKERPIELAHLQLWPEKESAPRAKPSAAPKRMAPTKTTAQTERPQSSPPAAHESIRSAPVEAPAPPQRSASAVPPPPGRDDLFLAAVRDELKWARTADDRINDLSLDRLRLGDGRRRQIAVLDEDRVTLSRRNPLVAAVLERFDADPTVLLFVASAVYSLMNRESEAITDEDERAFHRGLVENLGSSAS